MARTKQARSAPAPAPLSPDPSTTHVAQTPDPLISPSCDAVISQLRELVDPTRTPPDSMSLEIIHIRAGALIAQLKAINRDANAASRSRKQVTAEARHEMDQAHLGLQNFLYEKRHLEREIEKCRQFASIYQDVPLYSVEEFQKLAPPEARTEAVLSNEHQLMLNRLSFELAERQRLDQKKKELVQGKEDLLKQSRSKLATMDSIKTQIDTLLKTAAEIQRKVDELVLPLPGSGAATPLS